MIEIDIQLYTYTLCLVMIAAISSVMCVIHITKNDTLPQTTSKLFQIYFGLGLIAFIKLLTSDTAHIPLNDTSAGVFYIICSYVLFFAIVERARKPLPIIATTVIHLLITYLLLIAEQHEDNMLILSAYAITIYPILGLILIQRSIKSKNCGLIIIAIALILVSVMSPVQLHYIVNLNDPGFAYSLGLIAASVGFTLVGIGYLAFILIREQQLLRIASLHDPLTGLLNRRGYDLSIRATLARAKRLKECISIIVLDIDDFKQINDTYGHNAGDLVLKTLTGTLNKNMRESDEWCRLGGEEFGLILPGCTLDEANKTAEIIRQKIEQISINYEEHTIELTASFGVSSARTFVNRDALFNDADKALYVAKSQGKNRVCISNVDTDSNTDNLNQIT